MYTKPMISTYSGKSLRDLIGPVETQYCECELNGVDVTPDIFLCCDQTDVTITLNGVVATCPDFSNVNIRLIDPTGTQLTNDDFSPADGMTSGSDWMLPVYDFSGIIPDPGMYTIRVTVTAEEGCSSRAVTDSFEIL